MTHNKNRQKFLKQHQAVLNTLIPLEREIIYARSQKDKPDISFVIEDLNQYKEWLEKLLNVAGNIKATSEELDEVINKAEDESQILENYNTAIEDLIELHNEVIASHAYDSDLMEGRYLLAHITEQCLEQMAAYINNYRHQLNALLFDCGEEKMGGEKEPSVVIDINMDVGVKAFKEWLEVD